MKRETKLFFVSLFVIGLTAVTMTVYSLGLGQEEVTRTSSGPISLSLDLFTTGLDQPVTITSADVGDGRLFITEQDGTISIVESDGTVLTPPFLDIEARVDSSQNEEGLLGLVFHPNYRNNGIFYVNYTHTTGSRITRISRFRVTDDPNVADPDSEEILLTVNQPDWNHNAGDMHFGPDGYLYIPLGDGGGSGDPDNNAQNMGLLLGKTIRIDVDSGPGSVPDCSGSGTGNYTIPNDNPFIDGAGGTCDEIWASGLRNPWRFSFDRLTGDMYIGDVGQFVWEEIDYQPANSTGGEDYGWRCYEGNHAFNTTGCAPMGTFTFPIFEYSHTGNGCSVTGGYVYRGVQYPAMYGRYLLTDYCTGDFWDLDVNNAFADTKHNFPAHFGLAAFGELPDCELYVANRDSGILYHLTETTINTPAGGGTPLCNNRPFAVDDQYQMPQNGVLTVAPITGTLANDSDLNLDSFTAILQTPPTVGAFNFVADGSFAYTPTVDFSGLVTFTYVATDTNHVSRIATVDIDVIAPNVAPTAVDDGYDTAEETPLTILAPGILANDTDPNLDPITAVLDTDVATGTLSLSSDGSFIYTPTIAFNGVVNFTYHATDSQLDSNVATVAITVTAVNDSPIASGDYYTASENTTLIVPAPGVLSNDTDEENDPLTAHLVSGSANGEVDLNTDGSFTFTPTLGFDGITTFTYEANDGVDDSQVTTVTLSVEGVNNAPVASSDTYTTMVDFPLHVAAPGVLTNDTDVEGNPLTAVLDTNPLSGTLMLNSDGSFVYTPTVGFMGTDSFTYYANDGLADSNITTVTIHVRVGDYHIYLPMIVR